MGIFLPEDEAKRTVETAVNPPIYCDGLVAVRAENGLVYLAMWVDQPCLNDPSRTERVILERLVMTRAAFDRSHAFNHRFTDAGDLFGGGWAEDGRAH